MPLTQQQIDQLNVASQRVAEGYGSDTDRTNIDYATRTFGYSYTPPAQTPPPAQNTPPPPSTPNTPANVYGDVLGAETPQERALRLEQERQGAEYGTAANQVIDEEAIRLATEQRFQAEIDSLNRIYAEKKNAERLKGRGRLGTDTAIQSRRGLIGSTFGESQTNVIEDKNLQAESAVDDELNFELSQVRAKIRKEASDEVLAKRQAKKEGASSYMEFLAGQAERAANKVSNAVKSILSKVTSLGGVVDWNNPELVQIAKDLGISVGDLKRRYEEEEATQKSAAAEAEFKNRTKLSPGESMYDSAGNLLFTAPKDEAAAKLETQVVDGNLLQYDPATNSWTTIYAKPADVEKPLTEKERIELEIKKAELLKLGYMLDESGNPVTSKAVDPIAREKAQNIVNTVNDILALNWRDAVGVVAGKIPSWAQTGSRRATNAKIDTLKAMLTMENMGVMKGTLSDADMKILREASTALRQDTDEASFEREINRIKAVAESKLNGSGTEDYSAEKAQLQPGEILVKDKATGAVGAILQVEFDSNKYEKISFNTVGSDTNQASKIAAAIKKVESGGNYNARGGSGESGAYQFMPSTWKSWAAKYLGNANAPLTPANQDKVAIARINDLLKQGRTPQEIALIWNGGEAKIKKGVNKYGVKYDSGAYANKVLGALNQLG